MRADSTFCSANDRVDCRCGHCYDGGENDVVRDWTVVEGVAYQRGFWRSISKKAPMRRELELSSCCDGCLEMMAVLGDRLGGRLGLVWMMSRNIRARLLRGQVRVGRAHHPCCSVSDNYCDAKAVHGRFPPRGVRCRIWAALQGVGCAMCPSRMVDMISVVRIIGV